MNAHDRSNLEFLMSLTTDEQWRDWAYSVGQDDLDYAMEIMAQALAENDTFLLDLNEAIQDELGMDLDEARKVLDKFRVH